MSIDPWRIEAARPKEPARRPDLGPLGKITLFALGVLAALKAVGLVLVAGAVAAGVVGVQSGSFDVRQVLWLGCGGAILRAVAGWGTRVLAQRAAIDLKRTMRGQLWWRIAHGDAEGAAAAETAGGERPTAPARISTSREGEGSVAVLATDGLDDLDEYCTSSLPATVQAAVVPLVVGAWILGADWVSALVIVLTIPLVPLFMVLIGRHTQARTDEALGALTTLANHMTELARGLPVLVGLGRVDEQSRALEGVQRAYRQRTQETLRWAFLSALALELIATISVAIVAVFLGLRLLNGTVGLEAALVALILAPECFAAVRELGTAFHASQNGLSALARVREILAGARRSDVRGSELPVVADITQPIDLPLTKDLPERFEAPKDFPTLEEIAAGTAWADEPAPAEEQDPPPIVVRDLTVHYAGRAEPTLFGFSAEIGEITAITGPSGAGKSTLLGALTGTLPADAESSGWVVGIDTERVAWAPQAPHAFTATPWDELALFGATNPEASLRELGLARVADSSIAELSPGELRRLAVARALARVDQGASVLVLDEPTAHLDAASADRVRAAIRRRAGEATIVLATHEPETLALATRRLAVDAARGRREAAPAAVPTARGGSVTVTSSDDEPAVAAAEPSTTTVGIPVITDQIRLVEPAPEKLPALRGPRHRVLHGSATPSPWRALARILRPARGRWALGILLAFATIAMGLSLTAVSGWLIVRASVEEYIMYLLVAIVGVRFFGIGRAVSRYAERLVTHDAAFRATDALRLRLWRSIAARGAGSRRLLEGGSPLDYLVTLADDLRDQLPRTLPPLAAGTLAITGIAVTTAIVAPHLAFLVAATLVVAAGLGVAAALVAARGASRARVRERSALVRGTAALASAADDLRANGIAGSAVARLEVAGARLAAAERRNAWSAGLGSAIVVLAASALAVVVPAVSVGAPAELVCVVALLALAAVEPLEGLVAAAHRLPTLREVVRRLSPLMAAPTPVSSGTAEAPRPVREVALAGVAAQYPGQADPVFRGVTGTARAGAWLVVSGRSGTGKSTLLSVVMGALPATEGAVTADGVPLTDLSLASWRRRIAWCPQDAYVFDSSIRANLLLARAREDAPSDADMADALRRAGLGRLLEALPGGLDAGVGAGGSALSGGERQRLAVARALLTRADVILLDEPTAHLDAPTAADMMADVRAATADRVVLLVSHRADDVALAGAERIAL
ncbi:thiol reductant ABC exporter subunit CydC [Microbacterium sp. ZXX196]|uniref:thiol reductant ABC exporter subunit CydC n=1 Tax=Microbacterium sp. ZXX196 TaxID=2609291 RepID=UPI0012B7D415|nr:thiol reductant ABC exporter subunit CydC [Microbacterium sp. ZXX196]MTE24674.1 thiol reductant ABC exporter subunit CydC [Microbacterium sp. ZXX196]